ncbi:MAG TPA: PTS sugar transporter subunit IIB [Gemmatimonadales bacterium]|nr:PTS sugar transporter subunit IIB [Gemmatimonadales bacterium]
MSLVLVRVDDRYVHGQVVVGWGRALNVERIVLVDDGVRAGAWEQDLYRIGVPPDVNLEFASVSEAASRLEGLDRSAERVLVLMPDVDTLVKLCANATPIKRVNIGGLHQGPGRRERLTYVFLSDQEAAQLRELSRAGISVTAQDVPSALPVPLGEFA